MEYHYADLCLPPEHLLTDPYTGEYVDPYLLNTGEAEYEVRSSILVDGGDRFGVSAVVFDKYEELVWMGNQGGHVTSYYGPAMQKYTSFQVHESEDIRCIGTLEQGILALSKTSLRHQIRRGIPKHTHRSENMRDMQCLLQLSPHRVLVGGHQDKLLDLDLNKWKETVIDIESEGCCVMRGSGGALVACGGAGGTVTLRDLRCPARAEHTLTAHSACLSDLDMQGDLLITCGFANSLGGAVPEQYVVVWDVRRLKEGACSIALPISPLLLHFLPAVSGRAAAVSAEGRAALFHVNHDPRQEIFQVGTQNSLCTVFDISATSQALVFGDQAGHLHLFSPQHNTEPIFNNFSRQTEFADPVDSLPFVSYTDTSFQLSSVPLPPLTTGAKWFSDWPPEFNKKAYRKPKPIDPEVLKTIKMQGPIGYAPNPRTCRRNEMPYIEDTLQDLNSSENGDRSSTLPIPKRYLKVEIRYNKHTSPDDLEYYNKTGFPGLEATLANSYCNPMLQLLYYTQPVKNALLSHTCAREFCLSCELGFLFRMLDTSSGAPCQASNFLRAFRTVPEAAALGLILPDRGADSRKDLIQLIQSWNRFILHQMHFELLETRKKEKELAILTQAQSPPKVTLQSKMAARLSTVQEYQYVDAEFLTPQAAEGEGDAGDENWERNKNLNNEGGGDNVTPSEENMELSSPSTEKGETEISELFAIARHQLNRCLKCDKEEERESAVLACALQYPPTGTAEETRGGFMELLRASLAPRRSTPAWCESCRRFSPTIQRGKVARLPPILAVNCGGITPQEKAYWTRGQKENVPQPETVPKRLVNTPLGKPCRYGLHCARPTCRFRHPERAQTNQPSSKQKSPTNESTCVVPHELFITLQSDGDVHISDKLSEIPKDLESDSSDTKKRKVQEDYSLSGVVLCVEDSPKNLVAFIKMDGDREPQWFLFNDVSITPVPTEEVVQFNSWWKSPCVLFYTSQRALDTLSISTPVTCMIPNPGASISGAIFKSDETRRSQHTSPNAFTPLGPHEMPTPGILVGMDAEFVTLNTEEVELRSDGHRSTVRPSHMAVARITCVRGEGPLEGVPFIDDYISTQEQVVDYLTKFSGIKPGDLDAKYSDKPLTTLKSTYKKLRYLVDSGVVFVGHGLKNDFRVINLVVPPEQIVDTVQLFHLPHHRMLSLKFLAYHFLGGTQIQSETHDSVEDARTALRLRRRWAELGAAGELRSALATLYRAGVAANFQVPNETK